MSVCVLTAATGPRDVLTASIELPLRGVWGARLEVDADAEITGDVTLALARDDGAAPQLFVGTVVFGKTSEGRARLVVAGGKGHLCGPRAPVLPPRNYVAKPTLANIVEDLVLEAGERLAAGVVDELQERQLARWMRVRGFAADGLQALRDRIEGWRVLPDGTVWAGAEVWPAHDPPGTYQIQDAGDVRCIRVAPEAADFLPGQVVAGKRIEQVLYSVGPVLRAGLYYQEPANG